MKLINGKMLSLDKYMLNTNSFTNNRKIAFITGITGQDGSYLAELLLEKGYDVHGLMRRSSSFNTGRIDHLFQIPQEQKKSFTLHYGDLTDSTNIISLIQRIKPDEIYNLGAQSHVKVSFESPEYTANSDALGTLRILEAIRLLKLENKTKFYQASTSEMFGSTPPPQNENSIFHPRSPYGVAKLYAHHIAINYREAYNIFAVNGILFNHESPRRGETFVTKKITKAAVRIRENIQDCLYLGNLDAKRDWGHAKDFVYGMWLMMQQEKPDDFVLATGKTHTVREFLEATFKEVGIAIKSNNKTGVQEEYIRLDTNKVVVKIDPRYFRPTEVDALQGDSSKAKSILNWKPEISLSQLIKEMVMSDQEELNAELHGKNNYKKIT